MIDDDNELTWIRNVLQRRAFVGRLKTVRIDSIKNLKMKQQFLNAWPLTENRISNLKMRYLNHIS
jgi:hypothetical protein